MTESKTIQDLQRALAPFARFTHERDPAKRDFREVFVPVEGPVWFYVGNLGDSRPHLHTDDFQRAREALGLK